MEAILAPPYQVSAKNVRGNEEEKRKGIVGGSQ